jgi:peptidoglycan/LPS O-acetylase OafA/YrhL
MGIAIIWICFYHSKVHFPDSFLFSPLFFLKQAGYGGVDIFLFLSGFGLMYGMRNKKYSTTTFYFTRLTRILPTYFLIFFVTLFAEKIQGYTFSLSRIILGFSTVGFWIHKYPFDWFIPSLIALYLLFPLFFSVYLRTPDKNRFFAFICLITLLALPLCLFIIPTKANYLMIFLARIPIFFIGAYIGHISLKSNSSIKPNRLLLYWMCLFCGIVSWLYIINKFWDASFAGNKYYGLHYYPFILFTLPVCMLVSLAMKKYSSECIFKRLVKWLLIFCGSYSLEIYLIHVKIIFRFEYFYHYFSQFPSLNRGRYFEYIVYFIMTLFLAVPLRKLSLTIQNYIVCKHKRMDILKQP